MADSQKTVGQASETGDRGTPTPFKDSNGNYVVVELDASGNLPVSATIAPVATQDVNITKVGGNAVTTTVPISGTVTADAGTNLNTSALALETTLGAVKTSVEIIDNAISGSGVNVSQVNGEAVDVGAGTEASAIRVTLPTDCTGVLTVKQATAGNLNMTEASASAIKTSVELIDDTVAIDDTTTHSTGVTKVLGIGAVAAPTDTTLNANDIGMPGMSVGREVYTVIRDAAGNLRGANVDANGALAAVVTQGTATNLKAQAECYQGGSAVAAGNPLQVSIANTGANGTAVKVNVASGGIASGAVASGAIASGAVASGAFASGSIASGAIASGAIAAGAIATGATSIAENEDVASAGADTMVKVAQIRQDTPVANAGVSTDGDYMNFRGDNFGKTWVTGTVPEDTAHIGGEAISVQGSRRIGTLASSAGSDADWATVNQTAEGAAWTTSAGTATPNGLLVGNFTSGDTYTALTNTAQVIKASAGNLYGYYIYNPNATATYVMIYNIAAASVTVGTSTAILVFCIPATSAANLSLTVPIPFSNAGWSIAAATTGGGNTAPSTALEAMVFYL